MNFRFNKVVLPSNYGRLPSCVSKAIQVCSDMLDGDIVDVRSLSAKCGWISSGNISRSSMHPALSPFHHVTSKVKIDDKSCGAPIGWWGNKKTIAELKKKYPR